MQAVNDYDVDKMYLLLQKQVEKDSRRRETADTGTSYHGTGFSIPPPPGFEAAGIDRASAIFHSKNRPDLLFLRPGGQEGITLQPIGTKGEDLEAMKNQIRRILRRTDGKTVFYEEGEAAGSFPVLWFDYKSFAGADPVYNMMFLFPAGEKIIMGTFYCMFRDYDRWKPGILDMLCRIQEDMENERV